ncbi:MAG: alpha/beta fold hydrolase [Burkholderiales bacterium]
MSGRVWTARASRGAMLGALAAVTLAASGCAYLDWKQREWIFRPVKDDWRGYQSQVSPKLEELWLPVKSERADAMAGADDKLHAWWWPADHAGAPTVLYLHGTRWNLTGNAFRIARLQRMGFNVLAVDYRGFGRSSGDLPSEQWTYEDAATAWAYLKTREPEVTKRFIYGHSLGGAVAIDLATKTNDAAGLILEATFTSIREMVGQTWAKFLPVGAIITQEYNSTGKIADVRMPILFVHGMADRYVPYEMSERLHALAKAPKRLYLVEGAGHSNTMWSAFDAYYKTVDEFRTFAVREGSARIAR